MAVISFLLSLFFWISVQIGVSLLVLLSYPLSLLPGRGIAVIYFLARFLARIGFAVCFVKVTVEGKENLSQTGKALFIVNHPGLIEPLYLVAYFPRKIKFIAGKEILSFPLIGRMVECIGCIPYSDEETESFRFSMEVWNSLKSDEAVMFFPAAMRSRKEDPKIISEKLAHFVEGCGADIVPVSLQGLEKVFPEEGIFIRPGKIKIIIGAPIKREEIKNDLGSVLIKLRQFYL